MISYPIIATSTGVDGIEVSRQCTFYIHSTNAISSPFTGKATSKNVFIRQEQCASMERRNWNSSIILERQTLAYIRIFLSLVYNSFEATKSAISILLENKILQPQHTHTPRNQLPISSRIEEPNRNYNSISYESQRKFIESIYYYVMQNDKFVFTQTQFG